MPDEIGTLRTDVEVADPAQPQKRELIKTVLVDPGAELSWFPTPVLQSLGIKRLKVWHFRQADGTVLSRWTGAALVYAGGTMTNDEVVFGEPGDLVLLGSRSLEGLNLRVDPVSKQLIDAGPAPAAVAALGGLHMSSFRFALLLSIITAAACGKSDTRSQGDSSSATTANVSSGAAASSACTGNNAGLTLSAGFCATIFADSIGHARHVVVAPNGTVYVNTWSGRYYQTPAHEGGFLVALHDTNNDGRADVVKRFGRTFSSAKSRVSGTGGTGIALYKNYLYAEEGSTIVRYALSEGSFVPAGNPESVVTGLPLSGDHPMHPFVIDASGNLFMDSGTPTNSCQVKNRVPESPGQKPCNELQTRGGIWRFDANKLSQPFSASNRYATGIRNAVGIALAPDGSLYSTQHGRDQLAQNWPRLYSAEQGQSLPAEELLHIQQGADYGWPMCYFDNTKQKLVLAPEYGGDGGKTVGDCASKVSPVAFFPAHWAPDGLLFYEGTAFPEHYRGGAFIAFHGSWNRAPGPQGGYQVAFVPFSGGKPASISGFEKFADGFAEGKMQPDAAAHRPVGLAQAPDGSLYITDDKAGRIWRVTFGANRR